MFSTMAKVVLIVAVILVWGVTIVNSLAILQLSRVEPLTAPTFEATVGLRPTATPLPPINIPQPSPTIAISTPTPTLASTATPEAFCLNEGEVAWERDAEEPDNEPYETITFSGIESNCWVVGQVWTDVPTLRAWVFALPPGGSITFTGFRGGRAWYAGGNTSDIEAAVAQQIQVLRQRESGTGVVIQPLFLEADNIEPPNIIDFTQLN